MADDRPENRLLLLGLLEPLGFELIEVANGLAAVEAAEQHHPDLIVIDLVMPVMNGFEAVQRIHAQPALQAVPIVVVSASVMMLDETRRMQLVKVDLLAKPIDMTALLELIGQRLGLDWIIAATDPPEPPALLVADPELLSVPPAAELEALYNLARLGAIERLQQRLDRLRDDNPINLRVAADHLRVANTRILTARSGEDGIERDVLAQPDLILLDVQLPGINGFETCRRLKADVRTSPIPVIFTTVLTGINDILQGFTAGGVDYVTKPFQVEELLARVNTHLMLYRLQRDLHAEINQRREAELALNKANRELQRLAVLDPLTQIANRRRFDVYLHEQALHQPMQPLSLLLCDIDYFKQYNDGYGHQAGDHCLRLVAQTISRSVRHIGDLVARYGGEEFVVILPDTDLAGAKQVALNIQHTIARLALAHAYAPGEQQLTLSIGVACLLSESPRDPALLIAAADQALYDAKDAGRNQIVVAPERLQSRHYGKRQLVTW